MASYDVVDVSELEGEGPGGMVRKARRATGARAFGFNYFVLPPNQQGREHDHAEEGQEEVYFVVRGSGRVGPAAQELVSGLLSLAPAALALRSNELAAYHGAEHVSIGSYEHGEARTKEHERCGSHLLGPLLATSALGGALAARAPESVRAPARVGASLGALAASTELFGWMVRNPERRLARALARPGHELQHRLATAEPSAEQLEVAEAALRACLALEHDRH